MLIVASSAPGLAMLGATITGFSVAWFVFTLLQVMFGSRIRDPAEGQIEARRQLRVSRGSRIYRWFGPLIDDLTDQRVLHLIGRIDRVRRDLKAGGEKLPFTAEEFLGVKAFQCLLVFFAIVAMIGISARSIIFAAIVATVSYMMRTNALHHRAEQRKLEFKRRLPFAVDLIALMMDAGASFRESLATIVRENQGHPLGEEFGQVLSEIEYGQTLRQALSNLRDRLADNELNEMIFAVHKAEELGTPLSKIFLGQAEQMRLKRSQWAEKLAGKANANISFPGLVVMLGCILIVMGPFVLNAFDQSSTAY